MTDFEFVRSMLKKKILDEEDQLRKKSIMLKNDRNDVERLEKRINEMKEALKLLE